MRILLVEDHRDTLDALARLLAKAGHLVMTATTAAEANVACDGQAFDLAICDIGLPDGDGWELMRQLHRRFGLNGIALTGYGMPTDVARSFESGFRAHLTKPVVYAELLTAVREAACPGVVPPPGSPSAGGLHRAAG